MQKTRYSFDKKVSSQLKAFIDDYASSMASVLFCSVWVDRVWASATVDWDDGQDLCWHVPFCLWLWANSFLLRCRKCLSYLEETEEGVVALLVDCHPGSTFFIDYPWSEMVSGSDGCETASSVLCMWATRNLIATMPIQLVCRLCIWPTALATVPMPILSFPHSTIL